MTGEEDDGGEPVGVAMLAGTEVLGIGDVDVIDLVEVLVDPGLVGTLPVVGCVVPSPVPLDCCTDGEFVVVVVKVVGLGAGFDVIILDEGGMPEVGIKLPAELEVSSSPLDVVVVVVISEMEVNPLVVSLIGNISVTVVVSEVDVES